MKLSEVGQFNLEEAYEELGRLIVQLRDSGGEISETDISVDLAEIFWHLSFAWNGRDLTFDDVNNLSSAHFKSLGDNTPKFHI